jgi:hypothetical protein
MADKTFIFIGMVLTMLICLSQADDPSQAGDGPTPTDLWGPPGQKERDQLNYK